MRFWYTSFKRGRGGQVQMKRKLNKKLIAVCMMASLCFSGCGKMKIAEKESVQSNETIETDAAGSSEITESITIENTEKIGIDIDGMMEAADQEAALLEKKLTEDATLTQSDMNALSQEIYMIWDNLLNELWGILKENLDQETMDTLLKEQRIWITEKEVAVKEAGAAFSGGSMATLAANQKAAELTKARVQVLVEYLR